MPNPVVTNTVTQPLHTSHRARRSSRPVGHTAARNTAPPRRSAIPAYKKPRSMPYTTPPVRLPPVVASSEAAAFLAFLSLSVAFDPTWNVYAPSIGCESDEMTRQVTT